VLTIEISKDTIGKYVCKALVEGFQEIESSAEVLMKGAPRFYTNNAIQYGQEGTDIEIICNAFSIPPPDQVSWVMTSTGLKIDAKSNRNPKYNVNDEKRKDGMKSTLVINNALFPADFGEYNCTVKNVLGEDNFVLTLKRERSLPLIIILSAVIAGIMLTILMILIMILGRRSTAISLRIVNGSQNVEEEEECKSTGTPTSSSSTSSITKYSVKSESSIRYDKSYGLDLDDPLLMSSLPTSLPHSIDVYDELIDNINNPEYLTHSYEDKHIPTKPSRRNMLYESPNYKRNHPVPPPRKAYRPKGRRASNSRRQQRSNNRYTNKRPSETRSYNSANYQSSVQNDDLFSLNTEIYSNAAVTHI